tara:strand:+ start:4033 stop:4734 length:702 start_codon:yes stop_codon:yes gene_type:complete
LVTLKGKPLLGWIIEHANEVGISIIDVVSGYKAEMIQYKEVNKCHNDRYFETNMVYSLWCAREKMVDQEVIISYGDICYSPDILARLKQDNGEVSVAIDKGWLNYWKARFDDPLDDAESLKINTQGHITEIGREIQSMSDVDGQYLGLVKLSASGVSRLLDTIEMISSRGIEVNGRRFEDMYLTDLLDYMIGQGVEINAVEINRNWVEIDDIQDRELAERISVLEDGKITFKE